MDEAEELSAWSGMLLDEARQQVHALNMLGLTGPQRRRVYAALRDVQIAFPLIDLGEALLAVRQAAACAGPVRIELPGGPPRAIPGHLGHVSVSVPLQPIGAPPATPIRYVEIDPGPPESPGDLLAAQLKAIDDTPL